MVYSSFRFIVALLYAYSIHCISCPHGYIQCALEGGSCDGTEMIAYGNSVRTRYTYQQAPIGCDSTSNNFGNDPSPSLSKECCRQVPEITGPLGLPGPIVGIISCGQTMLSFFGFMDDIHFWKLSTDITYNITYTTCESSFDTRTNVYSASNDIISLVVCPASPGNPDQTKTGDDCNEDQCSSTLSGNEWFKMNNQPAGEYYVEVTSYNNNDRGAYQLQVLCSAPTISPTNDPTSNPTQLPSINPTIIPSTNPSIEPSHSPIPTVIPSNNPTLEPTAQSIAPTVHTTISAPTIRPSTYVINTYINITTINTTDTDIGAETEQGGDDNAATSFNILGIGKYMVYIICTSLFVCCCLVIFLFCYYKRPHDKETELYALRKKNELEMHAVAHDFSSDADNNKVQNLNKVRSHSAFTSDNDAESSAVNADLIRNNINNAPHDDDEEDEDEDECQAVDWKCLNCETVNDKTHVICGGCFIDKEKVFKKGKFKQMNNSNVSQVEHVHVSTEDDDESDSEEIEQIQQTIQIQQQMWIQKQIEEQLQTKKEEEMKQKQIEEQIRQQERQQKLLESLPQPPVLLFDAQHTARMSNDPNCVPSLLNVDEQSEIDAYHEGVNEPEGINDDGIDMEEKPIVDAQDYQ